MGRSKIEVFRAVLDNDEERGQSASMAFEEAYADHMRTSGVEPITGPREHRAARPHTHLLESIAALPDLLRAAREPATYPPLLGLRSAG